MHIVQPTVPNRDVLLHIVERAHRFDSLCVHSVVSFVHLARATVLAAWLDFDLVAFISIDVFHLVRQMARAPEEVFGSRAPEEVFGSHLVRQPFHSGDYGCVSVPVSDYLPSSKGVSSSVAVSLGCYTQLPQYLRWRLF